MPRKSAPAAVQELDQIEWISIDRLKLNPSNPRLNDRAVPVVADSLARFGWKQPVVERKKDGVVIAGNTRLKAALSLGMTHVPVWWFEGSEIDGYAFAIADNRTHEFALWDEPVLAEILKSLRAEDSLDGVGYSDRDIDALLKRVGQEGSGADVNDPGAQEPPKDPVSRTGDLWLLGKSRILCGDSTSKEDVARLMDGATAVLLATDPPYLVDYKGGNHPQSWANSPETRDKHWDDYKDAESGIGFFRGFLEAGLAHCTPAAAVYQWHAHRRQMLVEQAWREVGLLVHQQIIWVKARPVLTRSHYMWQHEPCFYGWSEGSMPPKDRRPTANSSTVWAIDQIGECDGIHPTQKPVDLFLRPIQAHSRPGEVVLEPFSGSGTQIMAAQHLGRACYAMEISPAFVDVAVNRWQTATGEDAILESSGESFAEISEQRKAGSRGDRSKASAKAAPAKRRAKKRVARKS